VLYFERIVLVNEDQVKKRMQLQHLAMACWTPNTRERLDHYKEKEAAANKQCSYLKDIPKCLIPANWT
jgi:hypothetical protein